MKSLKLVKRILPVVGAVTLVSGCSTTGDMYAKYDDICEVPKAKTVERIKIVKEIVEKEKIVEKKVPVEKIKYVDRIKEVAKVKYVDRVKIKKVPVETIKYVDRIKKVATVKYVPKVRIVERIKKVPVEKIKYVDRIKNVQTVKYVDRVKVQKVPVETIKYVDRVKIKEVPVEKIKYVERVKVKTVKQMIPGITWEPAVYFGFDLATLTPTELARLDRDLLVLYKQPELKLSVQAFTDSKGSNRYNRNLALRRQQTVVNYLVAKGLSASRILKTPLGEELPILGNSEAERVVNRRVELMLLDAAGRPLSLSIQTK